jgi:hypothetical protein
MPIARIQTPDGRIARFEVPDGTTPEQVMQFAEGHFSQKTTEKPKSEQTQKTSESRTVFDNAIQVPTFGFADEAMDAIGAAGATLIQDPRGFIKGETSDPALAEELATARENTKERMALQDQQNPKAALAGTALGIAATIPMGYNKAIAGTIPSQLNTTRGLINAIPKATTTAGNWARSGKTAQAGRQLSRLEQLADFGIRSAKGTALAAPSTALFGAGTAEDGERLEGAKSGLRMAPLVGTAGPAVLATASGVKATGKAISEGSKNLVKGFSARGAEALDDAAAALKKTASASYQESKNIGAVLNSQKAINIAKEIENAVLNDGKINNRLHGDTLSVLDDIKAAAGSVSGKFQKMLSLEELDQFRQLLSDAVRKNTDLTGQNPDARKASIAIDALDDAIDQITGKDLVKGDVKAVESLNRGRDEWRKFRKFEAVSDIIRKADGDVNKIKSGIKRLVENKKKIRGFTTDEVDALREASKNSAGESILKGLGRFGFEPKNVFLPTVGGAAATSVIGAAPAAALVAAGTASRQVQKYVGRGKAENALEVLEGKSTQKRLHSPNAKRIGRRINTPINPLAALIYSQP